ncbi:MAG: hypothetical protein AAF916_01560 [Planctomycetota bacterium]
MNRTNVRESSASEASQGPTATGDRYRWVPPVVALLLLLIVLLSLNPPGGGGAGDANPGASGGGDALAGSGQGNAEVERGGTSIAEIDPLDGSGDPSEEAATTLGVDASPTVATNEQSQTGHQSASPSPSSSPTTEPASAASGSQTPSADAAPLPALGFATDLAAAPRQREPDPSPTTIATPFGDHDTGSAGSPGLASFFGAEGHGTKFAYLIDKSGSMSGAPFEAAKAELIRSLRALQPHEQFFIAFYDARAEFMPGQRLLSATPRNVERAIEWVRSVSLGGSTNPTEALTHTLTRVRPDTIWLLSDGAFSAAVVNSIATHNPQQRTHINTLAFIDRAGEALLKIIADENRGDYRYVPGP